jgi:(E)-2-((N-methylformamido)methylene)succinate hydrolase
MTISQSGTRFIDSGAHPGTQLCVVLGHGVGLDLTMWNAQADALAAHCRVVRYDMLGHGQTPALAGRAELADYCQQLGDLIQELRVQRVVLVGFSMGGVIAQRFAADHADLIAGVVLMSTVYRRTDAELQGVQKRLRLTERDGPDGIVEHAVERWFPEQFQHEHPDAIGWIRETLGANDARGYTDAYRVFVQADTVVGDALTNVKCPAMVITGGDDVGSTPAIAERMCADLDNAELHVLPKLRHMVTMQAPDTVNALLLTFIQRVQAADSGTHS